MRRIAVLGLLAAAGCNIPSYTKGEWPAELPPEQFYVDAYTADHANAKVQSSNDYFDWVLRFYKGYQVVPGWEKQEAGLKKQLGDEAYAAIAPRLWDLGRVISAEWAKLNTTRKIDSAMLQLWGNVLQKSCAAKKLDAAIDRINADVKDVLVGTLAKADVVKKDRYADVLPAKTP